MKKETPIVNICLDLDPVTSEQLVKYMQFVQETNRYPQYEMAEHAVSLLSFALEEHETFQAWLSKGNRLPSSASTRSKRAAAPLEASVQH